MYTKKDRLTEKEREIYVHRWKGERGGEKKRDRWGGRKRENERDRQIDR